MKLDFPVDYFEDEVRDGYYVDGMMKRCWAAQLEVLSEIDKVCKRLGITWYADCGTLIGAVRHGGYVPWDDDLDICMLRDDYELFRKHALEMLPEGYTTLYYDNDLDDPFHVWDLLFRVINNDRYTLEPEFLARYHDFPFITGVDIFPLDFICPDPEIEETRRALGLIVKSAAYMEEMGEENPPDLVWAFVNEVEEKTKIKIDRKKNLKLQMFEILDRVYSMYNRAEATEVALMPYWVGNHDHKYKLEWFKTTIRLPFETTMVTVPAYYDDVLRVEYGDYMRVVRAGGTHDYPYYNKQYDKIVTREGKSLYKYYYEKEHLELKKPEPNVKIKKQAADLADLLGEAHGQIVTCLSNDSRDLAVDLLAQCQELAIRIGTLIESEEGEGHVTVSHLEKYCEVVYEIHSSLSAGESPESDVIKNKLDEALAIVRKSIEDDVPLHREVVFLPFSEKHWSAMESMWRREMDDPYCKVYVIPIPYYDRELEGVPRTLIFDRNAYPDEVEVTDFNDYNFAEHHPDTIYIQNIYDEFNPTTMVNPFFYTPHIRQFTDELVYIPYFRIEEIAPDDGRGKLSLDHFVKMPGMVQVDKAIVQSESVRQSYIEALVEMAGEETREIWEKKVVAEDQRDISADRELHEELRENIRQQSPESWRRILLKADGTPKKVILFYSAPAVLLGKDLRSIDKLERVLETFRENTDDIALIWKGDPNMRDALRAADSRVWSRYRDILDKYKKEGWGIFDTGKGTEALELADAYYGDPSLLVLKCKNKGLPVMLLNVDV